LAHGYEITGLLLFVSLAVMPLIPALLFAGRYMRKRDPAAKRGWLISTAVAAGVYAGVCSDAFLLEPNWPRITAFSIDGNVQEPVTILQLADLHLEQTTPRRERWLAETLKRLHPDLILLTGDVHQMDNLDIPSLREKLDGIAAPLGVYACAGYDNIGVLRAAAPGITWLENQGVVLTHGRDTLGIAGLCAVGNRNPTYEAVKNASFRLAIHHTPGLADEAAAHGMNLYLCGHTHGGQVRIPFWGAIITNSPTGKQYERGLCHSGKMPVYTSSGLGLEPPPAPQVRFLCRPEITMITIRPAHG